MSADHPPIPRPCAPSLADAALERVAFLEWRLEQLQATLDDALLRNQQLRQELSEVSADHAERGRVGARQEARLTEARREAQSLAERLALAERARASAEARARDLERAVTHRSREAASALERERQRAEVAQRGLTDAQLRLDVLERAHAQYFVRLEEWQRLLGTDPDRIDLAALLSELRGEVVRLSEERARGRQREADLRQALAERGAPVPDEAPDAPVERGDAGETAPQIEGASPVVAALPPAGAEASDPDDSKAALRATLKAKLARLDATDVTEALAGLPAAQAATAERLLAAVSAEPDDRALRAAGTLARVLGPRSGPALVARLRAATAEHAPSWLTALGRAGGPLALEAAHLRTDAPDDALRAVAWDVVAHLSPASSRPEVLEAGLRDAAPRVRRRVAQAAAALLGADATPLVEPLLRDPDPGTRRLATTLLRGRHALASRPKRTIAWST